MAAKPALALNGVSKHFGGVTVADNINFECRRAREWR